MHVQQFRVTAYPGWGRTVELRSLLPLIDASAARTWIHCAIEGTWKGHPNGPFEFTQDVFEQIRSNLKRQENSVVPLHYGHPDYKVTPEPEPAGFVHDFAIRDDGLWALIELFPETAEQIKAGKFRFCSVVVHFDSIDRKTGEPVGAEVFEIGLTNSPFIDGLTPIKLSRSASLRAEGHAMAKEAKATTDDLLKEAKKRAGDNPDPRKFAEIFLALVEFEEKMSGAGGDPEAPKEDAPAAASTVPASRTGDDDEAATKLADATVVAAEPTAALNDEAMTLLMQALSMTPQEVVAWLREHAPQLPSIVGAPSETADSAFSNHVPKAVFDAVANELRIEREKNGTLTATTDENAEDKAQKAAEEKADALVKNNRLSGWKDDAQRAEFVRLARHQPKQFDAIVAALPEKAVPTGRITAKPGDAPRALSAHVVKVNGQEVDITPRDENEVALCRMTASTESRAKNLARYRAEQAARSL